ncbi:cation diffusion facilitator family transporter [bacterium]|nr:cation diffusion facilitator family transporter [bacterium]
MSTTHEAKRAWIFRPFGCTVIGLAGNVVLSAGKLVVGLIAGSTALVADAFHSIADVLSDIGILLALKAANRPPDANHPYGHHSFETLGAILVAAFMLLTAFFIGRSAVTDVLAGRHVAPDLAALWASLVSVAAKEVMARYTILVGRRHHSPALLANGAMHRSDAVSSLAAAVGIGGAIVGWPILDSIAALVIALFITKMGWDLLRENVMVLLDTMPDEALVDAIAKAAGGVECVQEVRDLKVRQRGSWYLADLRIAIHPHHTIETAHDIAHRVEDEVRMGVPQVARVFVHVEPGDGSVDHRCPQFTPDRRDHPERP